MRVTVRDNDVNSALRVLTKKMQREGMFRDFRRVEFYEKPCEKRARQAREAVSREKKRQKKALELMGY